MEIPSPTRIEFAAIVAMATALGIAFGAGFVSGFAGAPAVAAVHYTTSAGLVIQLGTLYLVYRAARRGARRVTA